MSTSAHNRPRWRGAIPLAVCLAGLAGLAEAGSPERGPPAAKAPQFHLFAFGKAMPTDPSPQLQRAWDAVEGVRQRIEPLGFSCRIFCEPGRSGGATNASAEPQVTRKRILDELDALRRDLGSNDTVVIYSHTHGVKSRGARPGGLLLDVPDPAKGRPVLLDWREYADRLLQLPARTVVVLTMACHSGGLVKCLNEDEDARRLWQSRRDQGRDFLVLTSQNDHSLSNPRRIDGRFINPFTHALIEALGGKADGFGSTKRDGRVSLGELAGYVPVETRRHTAPADKANDPDPQTAGSFSPDRILGVPGSGG